MGSGSGYRDELRGRLRAAYRKEAEAQGVAFVRTAKGVEAARKVFDRGARLKQAATSAYEGHRNQRVLKEFHRLQLKSGSAKPELRPSWARSISRIREQAEKNVFDRHNQRLLKIDNITRREIARLRREFGQERQRER